jgi:hypothetical protein
MSLAAKKNCSTSARLVVLQTTIRPALQELWCDLKCQEIENIKRMKQVIVEEVRQNCF